MFSMQGNTTNIKEMMIDKIDDNKMHDLYVREFLTIPIWQMYIQKKKKYIKLK